MSDRNRPLFFMKRSDRLIARLRHLLYGVRFAQQVDGQVVFVWTPLPEYFQQFDTASYEIDRLFDVRRFYEEGGYRRIIFFHSVSPFPPGLSSLQDASYDVYRPSGFRRSDFGPGSLTYSGLYVGYQFDDERKTPADLSREVRDIYRSLPLDAVVSRILDTAKSKINADSYAALHVRKGDVGAMCRRDLTLLASDTISDSALRLTLNHYLARTAPYAFYYPAIEKSISDGAKILFSSDSPETLLHFVKKYGPSHFIDVNKYARARYPIQKAFLDFNMLVGATRIISTGSTYAAFAAELGGSAVVNVATSGSLDQLVGFLLTEYGSDLDLSDAAIRRVEREVEAIALSKRRKLVPVPVN